MTLIAVKTTVIWQMALGGEVVIIRTTAGASVRRGHYAKHFREYISLA